MKERGPRGEGVHVLTASRWWKEIDDDMDGTDGRMDGWIPGDRDSS